MVYLDIYDSIFKHLEKIDIVDTVFEYSEKILQPLLKKAKSQPEFLYNEFILEFALFNFMHKNKLLIDFLSEGFYDSLNKNEKQQFQLVRQSKRHKLKFRKKIKIGQLDTKGRELHDFYFDDISRGKAVIVVSSASLDNLAPIINARLIENPEHKGKYAIIGGIVDAESYEVLSSLASIEVFMESSKQAATMLKDILNFGKNHTLQEIEKYNNDASSFVNQDKKIMRLNRDFFEKFGIGFDEFLQNFSELSNSPALFIEMAQHYLSIAKELADAIYNTNYIFEIELLHQTTLIKAYTAIIKQDETELEESMLELQREGKKQFKNLRKNHVALTRENIIKNQKEFLIEKIAPLGLDDFNSFFKKIGSYSPSQIGNFLREMLSYFEMHEEALQQSFGADITIAYAILLQNMIERENEIPYLQEALETQINEVYDSERFYDYIDLGKRELSILIFVLAVYFAQKNNMHKAYQLFKQHKPEKTKSFHEMFFTGKVLSYFEDAAYKPYFKASKEINRSRYITELEKFLKEKEFHGMAHY